MDVINSAAWILVVILLEIEVRVLTRWGGASRPDGRAVANSFKVVLYATLVVAAIYWGFKGDFLGLSGMPHCGYLRSYLSSSMSLSGSKKSAIKPLDSSEVCLSQSSSPKSRS